jgi:diguanylate cyclase (GGDEF)-like protein
MAIIAAALYWVIVAIWLCVLLCTLYFSRGKTIIFGSARILLAVVAIDTLRDIIENIYFGVYFGSQYGFFNKGAAAILGQPFLLILPKIANIIAGCLVLFILLLQWLPNAARERTNLGRLASVDGMTGLLNRQRFLELAEKEFERCRRYHRPLSMLMIDIDNFKQINDRYGHDIGDKVIVGIAKICRSISRDTDITARLGGEEFGMLVPETAQHDAVSFAERLRVAISETRISLPEGELLATVSIGVAEQSVEIELADLMKHADLALYDAKRSGRNRVCPYETWVPKA